MKNKILFSLVLILLFSFCSKVSASELCSPRGYTIATVNGIFAELSDAKTNSFALKYKLGTETYNNQKIIVDYLYNPTHLAGAMDIVDYVQQGFFDEKSDYDLIEMLSDASDQVSTQKLLLVGNSQGNFYANNFYDKTASQQGGVPKESIGVYGVATPASRVAGGGKYITSDTDKIVADLVGNLLGRKILPPNVHIPFKGNDDKLGHSFTDIYLKYEGSRIIADIKESLNKLKENDEQDSMSPCISAPEITGFHKLQKIAFTIADPIAKFLKNKFFGSTSISGGLTANVIDALVGAKEVVTGVSDAVSSFDNNQKTETENVTVNNPISNTTTTSTTNSAINTITTNINNTTSSDNTTSNTNGGGTTPGSGGSGSSNNVDTTPPVITILGLNPVNIIKGTTYNDLGATAMDARDGVRTVTKTGTVNVNVVGTYIITYKATDKSNNTKTATRTVNVVLESIPPEIDLPSIVNYKFNEVAGNITVNPLINPVSISFVASENVDWLSIRIEKEDDVNIYKTLMSGVNCVDGTKNCIKTWDGSVSKEGTTLENGIYKIKVHIKNGEDKEFYDYLTPYKITVDKTLSGNPPDIDSTSPVITILGSNPFNMIKGAIYTDAGATALDAKDGIRAVTTSGMVNTNIVGVYTITYTASDLSNNITTATRTVNVINNPNPPDENSPSITSYTLNGIVGSVTVNPLVNPLSIVLNANENVNWMSIKIEKEDDENIYKTLMSSADCVDGNNVCTKIWNGSVSKEGTILESGIYRIKVHIKNSDEKEFYDYLTPYVINVDTTIVGEPPEVDTIPPIITILGDNPQTVYLGSSYIELGATALDILDGVCTVNKTGTVDVDTLGNYIITYTASDVAGNISTSTRLVKVVSPHIYTYEYIPKYKFGNDNGDDNDWQVWAFNGSNIYDWSDTYVDGYLREQFKIQAYSGGFWCSQCLERGIFDRNPLEGFELSNLTISGLEDNPQNNMNDITYDITLQWDENGYTYTISHDNEVDSTGYTEVYGIDDDMWVGWDGSFNNFRNFPSGDWYGVPHGSPVDRVGGGSMVLEPYRVYIPEIIHTEGFLSLPNKGAYAGDGIDPSRGRTNLTEFNFEVIYTDPNGYSPEDVVLHITDTTNGDSISDITMSLVSDGYEDLSDGYFENGELYFINGGIFNTGDYSYYFSTKNNEGNEIRIPEDGYLRFTVVPSTFTYIPQYSFGTNNGDGNNWQIWAFNGSNIYDWSDTYSNNYLREQFKIQTYTGGFWCSQCLQRGIFNHDPQKGFEISDVLISGLENNPQNNGNGITYDVTLQWDETGYSYTISHDDIIDSTGHTEVENMDNNMWVGWDGSFNNFMVFPSGEWYGTSNWFPPGGYTGGGSMMLQPYPIYSTNGNPYIPPIDPDPDPDPIAPSITNYTFNGNTGDITINPLSSPISIVFSASENVEWVSLRIEKEDNGDIYKIYIPGADCDGSNICTQDWDGQISGDGELESGVYKVKIHIKDIDENEFFDYIGPYVINVDTSL
ncbi:MAG: DUF5011 domain-containing protein [Candidatus Paceibacterota bacterium]